MFDSTTPTVAAEIKDEPVPETMGSGSGSFTGMRKSHASSVQEWTGSAWIIVEEFSRVEGYVAQTLDAARVQGSYVGERVVTPCVPV
jgi:hypothetical protein